MHALIEHHRDEIASLCGRFGVRRLEVFGSAARRVDFDPETSDVDLLVSFDQTDGAAALEHSLGLAQALEGRAFWGGGSTW